MSNLYPVDRADSPPDQHLVDCPSCAGHGSTFESHGGLSGTRTMCNRCDGGGFLDVRELDADEIDDPDRFRE